MKRICCIGLLFLVISGCKPEIPENIIQPDKMQAILYDIHITDGYLSSITNQDSSKKVGAAYYKGIYKKFGTDSVRYTESMNYYYSHPDVLSGIYDQVTAGLKKTKDSLDKINAKVLKKLEAVKKDSLNKVKIKLRKDSLKKDSLKVLKKLKTAKKLKKDINKTVATKSKVKPNTAKKVK